ncbi:MAG: hypothetical protein KJ069_24655 [Anaerolineae bacterium]|nr:hypothetical protein [Anaerolineae bacterium]
MNNVTHTQLQELVTRLPARKLPAAYAILSKLTDEEESSPSLQVTFLTLPLPERRRLLAKQAENMLTQIHYEETATEREEWQGGDFDDY